MGVEKASDVTSVEPVLATVSEREELAGGHCRLAIALKDALKYKPGQYVQIASADASQALPIAGWNNDFTRIEVVVPTGQSKDSALLNVAEGDRIEVRGPLGRHLPLSAMQGQEIIVLAASDGIVSARSLVQYILANRGQYGSVHIIYGTEHPKDILFQKELNEWKSAPKVTVKVIVERPADGWMGYVGVPTQLLPSLGVNSANSYAYLSAPNGVYKFMLLSAGAIHLPDQRIWLMNDKRDNEGAWVVMNAAEYRL